MNGEGLIYIYGVFNEDKQNVFLAKLTDSLKSISNEIWVEGDPSSNINRLSRIINHWAHMVIVVCSDQYVDLVEKKEKNQGDEVVLSRELLAENLDINKLVICLWDNPSQRIPSFLDDVTRVDFTHNENYDAKIIELKSCIDKKLNRL